MITIKPISNNIKRILEEKEISVYRLAEDLKMSYPVAHALVNREDLRTTKLETLVRVAGYLNVPIEKLYQKS